MTGAAIFIIGAIDSADISHIIGAIAIDLHIIGAAAIIGGGAIIMRALGMPPPK